MCQDLDTCMRDTRTISVDSLLVGCLGKIGQEAISAAMESVTRDGLMRLGRGRAIAFKKRGPFSNFRQSVGKHNFESKISVNLHVSE